MKRELVSLRNAITMGCDISNPTVRIPYILENKQCAFEGIEKSIMLTLLEVKMMK